MMGSGIILLFLILMVLSVPGFLAAWVINAAKGVWRIIGPALMFGAPLVLCGVPIILTMLAPPSGGDGEGFVYGFFGAALIAVEISVAIGTGIALLIRHLKQRKIEHQDVF